MKSDVVSEPAPPVNYGVCMYVSTYTVHLCTGIQDIIIYNFSTGNVSVLGEAYIIHITATAYMRR